MAPVMKKRSIQKKQAPSIRHTRAMRKRKADLVFTACLILATTLSARADEPAPDASQPTPIATLERTEPVDFEGEILPILRRNCLACHSEAVAKSELVLETPQTIAKGGASGSAVEPGSADDSMLLLVASGDSDPLMPPTDNKVGASRLTSEELGLLKLWIDQGAKGEVKSSQPVAWQPLPAGVNPIYAVALSPDGQFAPAARANQIFIYHLPSGKTICRLTDERLLEAGIYQQPGVAELDLVQSLVFSPDGYRLASGGYRDIKIWERPRDAKAIEIAAEGATPARSTAISADGKLLATGFDDGHIRVSSLADGQALHTLTGHTSAVVGLAFLPDGSRLVSGSLDGSLRSWQVTDGAQVGQFDAPAGVNDIALTTDGAQVIAAATDRTIRIAAVPATLPVTLAVESPTTALATSTDGATIFRGAADGAVEIRDAATHEVRQKLSAGTAAICSLAISGDGHRLVAIGEDELAHLFDTTSAAALGTFAVPAAKAGAALDATGERLVSASGNQLIVRRTSTLAARDLATAGDAAATVAAISPDGRLLATDTTVDGRTALLVRDTSDGHTVATLVGHDAAIHAIGFDAAGARLVSGSSDKTARVWQLGETPGEVARYAGHTAAVTAVAFAGDEQKVVSGSADGGVRVWNAADGAEAHKLEAGTSSILAVGATTDGSAIVTVAADGAVKSWNASDRTSKTLVEPVQTLAAASVSRDAERIVALASDHKLRAYNREGTLLGEAETTATQARSLTLDSAGQRIALGTADRQVAIFDAATLRPLETINAPGDLSYGLPSGATPEVFIGTTDRALRAVPLRVERTIAAPVSPIATMVASPDRATIFITGEDGKLAAVQLADGAARFAVQLESPATSLTVSNDGATVALGCADGKIRLVQSTDGAAVGTSLGTFAGAVRNISFSPDGAQVAAIADEGALVIFDRATGLAVQSAARPSSAAVLGSFARVGEAASAIVTAGDKELRVASLVPQRTIVIDGGAATSVATFADGKQFVTGGDDNLVRIWDLAAGTVTRQVDHAGPVADVAVRPDGSRVASVGINNVSRLWNAADGVQLAEWKGDFTANQLLAQRTADATKWQTERTAATEALAAAEKDLVDKTTAAKTAAEALLAADKAATDATALAKTATEAKAEADKLAAATTEAAKAKTDAKAAADLLVTTAIEMNALAGDASTKATAAATEVAQALEAVKASVAALAASLAKTPDDKALTAAKAAADKLAADAETANTQATAVAASTTQLAAARTEALQAATAAQAAAMKEVEETAAAAKDATEKQAAATKAATDADTAAKTATQALTDAKKGARDADEALARATEAVPAGKSRLEKAQAREAYTAEARTAAEQLAASHERPLRTVAFSPDGVQLATAGDDPLVHVYQAESGLPLETFANRDVAVAALAFTSQSTLASASVDGATTVWQLYPNWNLLTTLGPPADRPLAVEHSMLVDRVLTLDFSPDGKLLASGGGEPSRSGELKLWNLEEGTLAYDFVDAHSDTVFGVAFSPDGEYLASAGADKFVKVFEVATGKFVKGFEGHTHHVLGVAWSPDGKLLASCGADQVVKIWNFESGEQQRTIGGFGKQVTSVAFLPDGATVVASSGDKTVRQFNVADGKAVKSFGGATDFLHGGAVTPDGRLVAAGGEASVLHVWNGADGKTMIDFTPPEDPAATQ